MEQAHPTLHPEGLVRDTATRDPRRNRRNPREREDRHPQGDHTRRSGLLGNARLPEKGLPRTGRGPLEQARAEHRIRKIARARREIARRVPAARHLPLPHRRRRRDHTQADGCGKPETARPARRRFREFHVEDARQLAQGAHTGQRSRGRDRHPRRAPAYRRCFPQQA